MSVLDLPLAGRLYPLRILAVISLVLLVFAVAEILRKFAGTRVEVTRKFVHIVAGLITLSFPYLFISHFSILILLACFVLLLLSSRGYQFLESVNAIKRRSLGSFAYPFTIYACFVVYTVKASLIYYNLPLLVFILCDPLAAFVGIQTKWKPYRIGTDTKTLGGSLAFLFGSFLLATFFLFFYEQLPVTTILLYSIIISVVASFAEAISPFGLDNLIVPLSMLLLLDLLGI
jgi:phytol kinase